MIPFFRIEEHLAVHLCALRLNLQAVALDRSITEAGVDFTAVAAPCTEECLVVQLAQALAQLAHVDVELQCPLVQVVCLAHGEVDVVRCVDGRYCLVDDLVEQVNHRAAGVQHVIFPVLALQAKRDGILLSAFLQCLCQWVDGQCYGR